MTETIKQSTFLLANYNQSIYSLFQPYIRLLNVRKEIQVPKQQKEEQKLFLIVFLHYKCKIIWIKTKFYWSFTNDKNGNKYKIMTVS